MSCVGRMESKWCVGVWKNCVMRDVRAERENSYGLSLESATFGWQTHAHTGNIHQHNLHLGI